MTPTSVILLRFLILALILFLIDLYVFSGIKAITLKWLPFSRSLTHYSYWILNIGLIFLTVLFFFAFRNKLVGFPTLMMVIGVLFSFLLAKLIFILVLMGEDVFRLVKYAWDWIAKISGNNSGQTTLDSRRAFISQAGLIVSSIPLAGMVYGMVKGKYAFKVHTVRVKSPHLPDEFHGFTITQISDFHAGSFDDKNAVQRGLSLAQGLNSDLIVFTGDLVNNYAAEVLPYINGLSELKSRYGKFSILGNHDYGDYVPWEFPGEKEGNFSELKKYHAHGGFRLLLNEHEVIQKGDSKIYLAGVENWGRGFRQNGDLKKSISGIPDEGFVVLLSHDPTHWEDEVRWQDKRIDLTLSGHTHGMQFGVEVGNFKWSPVKFRYPRWAGLFKEADSYLYVNRGFGFLGFPGRVGIWPEITQLILEKA